MIKISEDALRTKIWDASTLRKLFFDHPLDEVNQMVSQLVENINPEVRATVYTFVYLGDARKFDRVKHEKNMKVLLQVCATPNIPSPIVDHLIKLNKKTLLKALCKNTSISGEHLRTIYSLGHSELNDLILSHHAIPKDLFEELAHNLSFTVLKRVSEIVDWQGYDFGVLPSQVVDALMKTDEIGRASCRERV